MKRFLIILLLVCVFIAPEVAAARNSVPDAHTTQEQITLLQNQLDSMHRVIVTSVEEGRASNASVRQESKDNCLAYYDRLDNAMNRKITFLAITLTVIISLLGIVAPFVINNRMAQDIRGKLDDQKDNFKNIIALNMQANSDMRDNINSRVKSELEAYEKIIQHVIRETDKKINQMSEKVGQVEKLKSEIEVLKQVVEEKEREAKASAEQSEINKLFTEAYSEKDLHKQILLYTQVLTLDSQNVHAYNNRGCAYSNLKQYDRAIIDYKKALEINANDSDLYVNLGVAYERKGEYEKALENYDKAIELNPQETNAYFNRGVSYSELKQYDKALESYTQAIELNPKEMDAYYNRGLIYSDLKQHDKAIADNSVSIEIDSQYAGAYNNRAYEYMQIGELDKALDDANKAVDLRDGDYPEACDTRGEIFLAKREYDKALEDFNKATEADPQMWEAYDNKAKVYFALAEQEQDADKKQVYLKEADFNQQLAERKRQMEEK